MAIKGRIPTPEESRRIVDTVLWHEKHKARRRAQPRPRRRRHGSSAAGTSSGNSSQFTIAEYDAVTGEVLNQWYRGRNRSTDLSGSLSHDYDIAFADGFLYAIGGGALGCLDVASGTQPSADTRMVVKWNPDTGQKVWESSRNGEEGVGYMLSDPTTTARMNLNMVIVHPDDGYVWAVGPRIASPAATVAHRIDPDSGLAVASWVSGVAIASGRVYPAANGGVFIVSGNSSFQIYLLDSDAVEVDQDTTSAPLDAFAYSGDLFVTHTDNKVRRFSGADLSILDDSGTVFSSVQAVATDGSTVFVRGVKASGIVNGFHGLDIADLESVLWSQSHTATGSNALYYGDGRLYSRSATGGGVHSIRKINPADGSEIWTAPDPQTTGVAACLGIGSDFVVGRMSQTEGNLRASAFCVNDSDGSIRWRDSMVWRNVVVTPDDRIFACSIRTES